MVTPRHFPTQHCPGLRAIASLLLVSLLLCGCSTVVKTVFGINMIDSYDEAQVISFHNETTKAVPCRTIIATVAQVDSMIRLDLDTNQMYHRAQPAQILYFDGDSLLFWHLNCFAQSGLLSYNWDRKSVFSHFPPAPSPVSDLHGSMTLSRYRSILPDLEPGTRYTIIVMWSNVLRRISKDAVATVAANISHRDDCTLYLVNTDQWWVSQIKRQ